MNIKICRIIPDLRVHALINNILVGSRGYDIYTSGDLGKTWVFRSTLPVKYFKRITSNITIVSRLLRTKISNIIKLNKNKILICCDKKMFLTNLNFDNFEYVNVPTRFFQLLDNNICITPKYIYYGEYFPNKTKDNVNIYFTIDGFEWELVYSFPKKSIRHIHLLQYDPIIDRIWFSTGDLGKECILGNADFNFSDIEIIGKNDQKWRCVELLFDNNNIYFGTEDPKGENWIYSLDRNTHNLNRVLKVYAPVYNIKKLETGYILITANERGEWDRRSHIWYTNNLKEKWQDCISFEKDCHHSMLGFGRLLYGCSSENKIFLTGQALKNIHNCTLVLQIGD